MKRLLSFLILLATFNASCMHATFADFFAGKESQEISMHHNMESSHGSHNNMPSHDMSSHEDCEESKMHDCMEDLHNCCGKGIYYAVFQSEDNEEYEANSSIIFSDFSTHESLLDSNLVTQLNAPPYRSNTKLSRNQYIELIGIIKNNA